MKQNSFIELHESNSTFALDLRGNPFTCFSALRFLDWFIHSPLFKDANQDCRCVFHGTGIILSFRTHRPGQTVQTQIRLLLEDQSGQGQHCLQFPLHILDALRLNKATLFNFKDDYSKFSGVRIVRNFRCNSIPTVAESVKVSKDDCEGQIRRRRKDHPFRFNTIYSLSIVEYYWSSIFAETTAQGILTANGMSA